MSDHEHNDPFTDITEEKKRVFIEFCKRNQTSPTDDIIGAMNLWPHLNDRIRNFARKNVSNLDLLAKAAIRHDNRHLYSALVQMSGNAEQVSWNRFYNYLVANSVLVLAWATIYNPDSPAPGQAMIVMCAICVIGLIMSLLFLGLGVRSRMFLKHYISWGAKMETDISYQPRPFTNIETLRDKGSNKLDKEDKCPEHASDGNNKLHWKTRLSNLCGSKWIFSIVPILFASLYLIMFGASINELTLVALIIIIMVFITSLCVVIWNSKRLIRDSKNVFVIIECSNSETTKAIKDAIEQALSIAGLQAQLAEESTQFGKQWGGDVYKRSKFGVVVICGDGFDLGMAMQIGFMLGCKKQLLLLKDKEIEILPAGFSGLKTEDLEDLNKNNVEQIICAGVKTWLEDLHKLGILKADRKN